MVVPATPTVVPQPQNVSKVDLSQYVVTTEIGTDSSATQEQIEETVDDAADEVSEQTDEVVQSEATSAVS